MGALDAALRHVRRAPPAAAPLPAPSGLSTAERRLAVFDFDGTLTDRDTLLPFLRRACGVAAVAGALAREAPSFVGVPLRLVSRDDAKERLIRRLLAGRRFDDLDAVARDFAAGVVARWLRPDTLQRVEWHRRSGDEVVIVSASPELYLRHVGAAMRVDALLATRLRVDGEGRLTGAFEGGNVRGAAKERRLREWLGGRRPPEIWAYGDSRGDEQMLAMADVPTRVRRRRRRGARR